MGLNLRYTLGQTRLEEEEKEGLKIQSINTQTELDEFEHLNIERAVEWTINSHLKRERILTEKFIQELHKRMYGDVWKWAGEFRRTDKNFGIQWPRIHVELKKLLDDAIFWVENNTYPPNEIAIRFKHRIVTIHCFANGNGRHSRMMADIIMESIFGKEIFSWHESNLAHTDETRKTYIAALKEADEGNIQPLIEFAES